ncbi:hypothetical protein [Castellaniella sp.]|uniref:hypothetical protein n=1 Tax=Castellaniella sp. TaxID=1955812 RepID=UPI002AFE9B10|nr:hypothetical protein [Castellaniella sp.]
MTTIRAEISRLANLGMGWRQIHARLPHVTLRSIAVTMSRLRAAGEIPPAQPRKDRPAPVRFHLDRHEFTLLCADAEQRDMEPRELAAEILVTVLRDNLVDAVLDDGRAAA